MARTPTPDDAFDRATAIRAARRFYVDDRSKVEIAEELGVSRFKVARLLETAKTHGLVTITIADDGVTDEARSATLAQALGLERALVVPASGRDDEVRHVVGGVAAELLATTIADGEVLGMGWGRTLSATAEAIEALPRVDVVQMTGVTEMTRTLSPVEIVRRLGLRAGGDMMPVFAPLVADDADAAQTFRRQSDIARALAMHEAVTTAVMSVGSWNPPSSQLRDAVDPALRTELLERGVVAEIGVTLVDASGAEVAPDFAERCIAVTADRLRAIPRVVGVAASAEKAMATIALARAGLVTEVVVDGALADEVLRALESEAA